MCSADPEVEKEVSSARMLKLNLSRHLIYMLNGQSMSMSFLRI